MQGTRQRGFRGIRLGHVVITVLAIGLASVAVLFFSQPATTPGPSRDGSQVPRVVVDEVRRQAVEQRIEAIGRVLPWQSVELTPELSGRVEEVHVGLGDRVRAGEALLTLDSEPYEETVRERRAALRRARAHLAETSDGRARLETLRDRGMISEREYEAALARHRTAEADVEAAEAALDRARRQLRDTELRAPFAGTIVDRRADPGDLVGPERPVLELADLDTVAVEAGLTESEVSLVRTGQSATVQLDRHGEAIASGEVVGTSERADPTTGTYKVRIRVDNTTGGPRLLGGQSVRVGLPRDRLADALTVTVPTDALVYEDAEPYVYEVEDGRAWRVRIEVQRRLDDRYAVRELPPDAGDESRRSTIDRSSRSAADRSGAAGSVDDGGGLSVRDGESARGTGAASVATDPEGSAGDGGTGVDPADSDSANRLQDGDLVIVVGQSQVGDGARVEVAERR